MTTKTAAQMSQRRASRLAGVAAACALMVSACGDGDVSEAQEPTSSVSPAAAAAAAPAELIDINTASESELLTIPGVGEGIADELVEYRPYDSFEKYREEMSKYISDEEIARIETYLTLG